MKNGENGLGDDGADGVRIFGLEPPLVLHGAPAEMETGQWVMGHGSNGSPFLDGSRGSWVTASDPLTHDEITAQ